MTKDAEQDNMQTSECCGQQYQKESSIMLVTIKCIKCNSETQFSASGGSYQGPFRCWKCKEIFAVKIEGNELKSCEPFSQDEAWKIKKLKY